MIYCFDLDNTICTTIDKDYDNAVPDYFVIKSINELYDVGHEIKIFTARGMGQFNGNVHKVYDYHYTRTKTQLQNWNVKYHDLILGKPSYDIFIDDKNITVDTFKKHSIRGVVAGAFDVIHPGYVHMFREMNKYCTHLTVFLHTDPSKERSTKLSPALTIDDRINALSSIRYVDEVITYDTEDELYSLLKDSKFNIRFLGKDYLYSNYTGKDLPIHIHFIDRDHGWSTTKFKKLIASNITNNE